MICWAGAMATPLTPFCVKRLLDTCCGEQTVDRAVTELAAFNYYLWPLAMWIMVGIGAGSFFSSTVCFGDTLVGEMVDFCGLKLRGLAAPVDYCFFVAGCLGVYAAFAIDAT